MTAIALTIAGSDSSGGPGIQADLKTFAAHQVYGASVIVALTAQNTQGVSAIHAVPRDFVAKQMDAVFEDLDVGAVKIGMLATAELIETVANGLKRHGAKNVVLPGLDHRETAFHPLAFAAIFEFLMGAAPATTGIAAEISPVLNGKVNGMPGGVQVQEVRGGGSYYSQNDLRVTFGLGGSTSVERVEVRWPNGFEERWDDIEIDRIVTLKEGGGVAARTGQ